MEIPPKDNRKTRSSNTQGSSPKTKKRGVLARYLVPVVCICVGIALLAFAAWRFATITVGTTATTERAISDILNMADRGQLKSVSISGNDVVATGTRNQKFHAVKEDGEAV